MRRALGQLVREAEGRGPETAGSAAYASEMAYRRGVHQALSLAGDIVRERGHREAADLLDELCDRAGRMRFDPEPHPDLLHELGREFESR